MEAFQSFCCHFAVAIHDFDFEDAPDFVKHDKSVGVELVSYHRDADSAAAGIGSPRRRWEEQLERLLEKSKQIYFSQMRPAVDVYAFPSQHRLDVMPRDAAKTLADYVEGSGRPDDVPTPLARIFERVEHTPTPPSQGESLWQLVSADWLDVGLRAIQCIIDEKEGSIEMYRRKARELWLVIYGSRMPSIGLSGAGRWSTHGQVTPELIRTTFRTSFDRVYYLGHGPETCVKLLTTAV